ncbi:MAG: pilus assembly protein, partial [Bdellovibrionales bacterium]|nr:pilus assembly protein [Bdellovibrionales bacterium]
MTATRACRRSQRGQTSVFMALFISSLIMLFAFTVNIGMLVHAKINLQNAADAAAWAGAAVQARQLTKVAHLNYEIRRAVKEFSYLFAVKGSQAQACYPQLPVGQSQDSRCLAPSPRYSFAIWDPRNEPDANEDQNEFYIPTMCMIY